MTSTSQRIVIAGASGFLGTRLVQVLRTEGYEVVTLQRGTTEQSQASHDATPHNTERTQHEDTAQCEHAVQQTAPWDPSAGELDPSILAGAQAVICLSGASLVGRPWTVEYRWEIMRSRFDAVDTLVDAMVDLDPDKRPRAFLCASAVGIYGADTRGVIVDEASAAGHGFLAEVCTRWEERAQRAASLGVRTVNIRTGLVLGAHGGLLAQMLPAYRLGLGARLGDGTGWMPVVSLNDWVRAVVWMLEHDDLSGPVNVCCPQPVLNEDFHKLLGRRLRRPAFLSVPEWPLRALAPTFAKDVIFASQRAVPTALLRSGFTFDAPNALTIIRYAKVGAPATLGA